MELDLYSIQPQTFGGVRMTQSWADLALWERILNDHPELRGIVEIGTWEGGMSRFLAAQAVHRKIGFVTFDVTVPPTPPHGFRQLDVFKEADAVRDLLRSWSPVILLCDGGDKPREMQTFAPALNPGDLLVVHDWRDEAKPEDVPDCLEGAYPVADFSHTAAFVRRAVAAESVAGGSPTSSEGSS